MTVDLTARISARREAAKAELEKKDLVLPGRPKYALPKLPLRLSDLDDHEMMQLMVRFTRYQDHLSGQLVEAEIDERSASGMLEYAKAKHLAKNWTGTSGDRVAVQKAEALMDPEVKEIGDAFDMHHARRKLLTILVESTDRDAAVVSRELTRRGHHAGHERRVDKWNP